MTELRRLVLHACSQLAALQSSTDAATAQLSARMALLEGRVKLVEAGAAARPAMAAAPPPMASAEAVELVAKEAARPPLARLGADPLTAPRPTAATAANPVAAASLGGRNRDMLSTKEYIADISRRMNLDAEAAEAAAGKAARMGF